MEKLENVMRADKLQNYPSERFWHWAVADNSWSVMPYEKGTYSSAESTHQWYTQHLL